MLFGDIVTANTLSLSGFKANSLRILSSILIWVGSSAIPGQQSTAATSQVRKADPVPASSLNASQPWAGTGSAFLT